jgi:sugar/nucleoside kinase (ribokinase family)
MPLSVSYPSTVACLHSLRPHDTCLTIIIILPPPSLPQSSINTILTSRIIPSRYICVNETELTALSGVRKVPECDEDIEFAANKLMGLCRCFNIIVTLGARGCFHLQTDELGSYQSGLQQLRSPAAVKSTATRQESKASGDDRFANVNGNVRVSGQFYRCVEVVDAVDTTGAGDSFLGAFAAHLSRGSDCATAIRAGLYVATRSVCGQGAQQSYARDADLAGMLALRVPKKQDKEKEEEEEEEDV